jgi:uncharacterized membrane protein (DUF2068 family)
MTTSRDGSARVVLLIGAFKLVKSALLIALAVLAWRFADLLVTGRNPLHRALEIMDWAGAFPGRHVVLKALDRLWAVRPKEAVELGIGALAYAAVFLVEGVGLLLRKRWAEWLTVGVTASFIPVEVYEMVEHFGAGKVITVALNVAIVAYLIWHRLRERRRSGSPPSPARGEGDHQTI